MILDKIMKKNPVVLQGFLISSPQLFVNVGLEFHAMQFDWTEKRMPNVTSQDLDEHEWEVARKRHESKYYCTRQYLVPKDWEQFVEYWMYNWQYVIQTGLLF